MTNLRVLAFCLLIVAIAYANAAPLPFVQSDDFLIIASNPEIHSIAPLRFLGEPYWAGYKFGAIYRPLTILSFSIDWAIWGRWAPGFRLTNLLLHALKGWQSESSAAPSGLAASEGDSSQGSRPGLNYGAATRLGLELTPIIIVAAVYLTMRFRVLGGLGVPPTFQYMHGGMSLVERWMTSGRSFLQYFRLALAPVDVAASYEFNAIHVAHLRDLDAWAGLLAVLACIVAAIALAKKRPALSFAILFFYVALLPVSNWITPISVLVAERFLYTPVFGVALLAGIAWAALPTRRVQYLTGAGVLAAAIMLGISHNWTWHDDT